MVRRLTVPLTVIGAITITLGVSALTLDGSAATRLSAPEIRTYIQQVQLPYTKADAAETLAVNKTSRAAGLLIINHRQNVTALSQARSAFIPMQTWTDKLAQVKAPAGMSEVHVSLVRNFKVDLAWLKSIAAAVEKGNRAKVTRIVDAAPPATLARHWKDEVTAAARAAGVPVPLWVKKVGA